MTFHINADWAQDYLEETADSLGLELFLINQDGTTVLSTDPGTAGVLHLPSIQAATAGVQAAGFETWPDGRSYFTTIVPQIAHGTLPSFGWRLVGRIDPTTAGLQATELWTTIVTTLVGAGLVLLAMAALFARLYLRPVWSLARNADRIADGHDDYPYESQRTAELALLSAAIARLQSQRG